MYTTRINVNNDALSYLIRVEHSKTTKTVGQKERLENHNRQRKSVINPQFTHTVQKRAD